MMYKMIEALTAIFKIFRVVNITISTITGKTIGNTFSVAIEISAISLTSNIACVSAILFRRLCLYHDIRYFLQTANATD
jgi:hypothetical protein